MIERFFRKNILYFFAEEKASFLRLIPKYDLFYVSFIKKNSYYIFHKFARVDFVSHISHILLNLSLLSINYIGMEKRYTLPIQVCISKQALRKLIQETTMYA